MTILIAMMASEVTLKAPKSHLSVKSTRVTQLQHQYQHLTQFLGKLNRLRKRKMRQAFLKLERIPVSLFSNFLELSNPLEMPRLMSSRALPTFSLNRSKIQKKRLSITTQSSRLPSFNRSLVCWALRKLHQRPVVLPYLVLPQASNSQRRSTQTCLSWAGSRRERSAST